MVKYEINEQSVDSLRNDRLNYQRSQSIGLCDVLLEVRQDFDGVAEKEVDDVGQDCHGSHQEDTEK